MPGWMKGVTVCHTNERVGAKVEAAAGGRTEGGLVDRIRWRENEGTSGGTGKTAATNGT